MGRPPGSRNRTATAERTETASDQIESKGEVAIFHAARLPYHPAIEERFGVDKGQWKVLVEAIFPAAKTVDAIVMALTYCKSRNLDPFKRPVHIVPMWDSARGAMVETVWPGISELRTTASRTKGYAGCDEAQFGEPVTMDFKGRVKEKGEWLDKTVTVEFPEWCRITVYRVVDGQRCKFVGPKVAWLETYASQGASELPNKMWQERPEGQLEKCAEAAALRRAFPEEIGNDLTAEEMIGRNVHDLSVDIPQVTEQPVAAGDRDAAPPRQVTKPEQPTEQPDPEAARDGTPPRRTKPAETKADPISSGPMRTAPKKEEGLTEGPPKPHRVGPVNPETGQGHSFESWTAQYLDLLRTSPDTATLYQWIDINTRKFKDEATGRERVGPLDQIAKGKPSVFAQIKAETTRLIEALRDAQQKAADKAAKKPAPAPSDMDGPTNDQLEESLGAPPTDNPEDVLKWVEATLAAVDAPEDLENIWVETIEPKLDGMFPPDVEEAQAIYKRHEKRLEP